jgi:lipopolysaccharide export system permease protein
MLIRRYLLREIATTFVAVIAIILLIAISNKFVRLIAQAAAGNIAPGVLLQVILFQIPELLAFLLPVGLFLAILLCYSRFFADNEMPVMLACGISWQRFLMVSFALGLVVMMLSATLTCYFGPKIAYQRERLLHEEGPLLLMQTVTPGRFHAFQKDKLVFYVTDINSDRSQMKQVFIAEQPKGPLSDKQSWSLLTAKVGKVIVNESTGYTYFKLQKGRRYNGTPGEADYSILAFDEYERLLEGTTMPQGLFFHRTMPTAMLLLNPSPSNMAELQWRIAVPLSAPLLALLAVPLSRVRPRQGRFAQLFTAVIFCILYYNLLTISKRWVASGKLSPEIGLWWVHGLLLILALYSIAKVSGRLNQGYQWLRGAKA